VQFTLTVLSNVLPDRLVMPRYHDVRIITTAPMYVLMQVYEVLEVVKEHIKKSSARLIVVYEQ